MKKVILVATVFLSVLSTSCSSDDDQTASPEWLGGWKLTAKPTRSEPLSDCEKMSNLIFAETVIFTNNYKDGTDNNCIEEEEIKTSYRIEGDKIILLDDSGNIIDKETINSFVINGNELTITTTYPQDPKAVSVYTRP